MFETEILMENIMSNWWVAAIVVLMLGYFTYSIIYNYVRIDRIKKDKKKYEDELVQLEKQYDEQLKILQAKRAEGKKFMKYKEGK